MAIILPFPNKEAILYKELKAVGVYGIMVNKNLSPNIVEVTARYGYPDYIEMDAQSKDTVTALKYLLDNVQSAEEMCKGIKED